MLTESFAVDTTSAIYDEGNCLTVIPAGVPIRESFDFQGVNYVDPLERLLGPDGELWKDLNDGLFPEEDGFPYRDEHSLFEVIRACRKLAETNAYAQNGHENRISYIVGEGHQYTVSAKADDDISEDDLNAAQNAIDEFCEANKWGKRQQEIVRRMDRDGEVFIRFFETLEGLKVRFVEPEQVKTPDNMRGDKNNSYGIVNDPNDVETVIAYYVDGQPVPAEQIQHRKANVDSNRKRGLPLFWSVRTALRWASKLEDSTNKAAAMIASLVWIRKRKSPQAAVSALQRSVSDATYQNPVTGKTDSFQFYQPGRVIDQSMGTENEFPGMNVNMDGMISVLKSVLRKVASRVVFPEFMLTSDASNANYSSTMVAEGPAVKKFTRDQAGMAEDDREILKRVLRRAEAIGLLSAGVVDRIVIQYEAPRVETRNRKEEIDGDIALKLQKVMSPQTLASKNGLDYEQEQKNIEAHDEKYGDGGFGGNPLNSLVDPSDMVDPNADSEDDPDNENESAGDQDTNADTE